MQLTLIALVSIVSVALAGPVRLDDIVARAPEVQTEAAAMSDANGNVVSFDSNSVYQPITNPTGAAGP